MLLDESNCVSLQDVNAEEFEDKEWTFVIEGVCYDLLHSLLYELVYLSIYQLPLLHLESM